jgi:hypothetical protein
MISQANISPNTPMGATLVDGGGATFRAWAPLATMVYINGTFAGTATSGQSDNLLLAKSANGYWTGFVGTAQEGDPYRFWVVGPGGSGYKRDPYARELAPATAFPNCNSLIRSATAYPCCLRRNRFSATRDVRERVAVWKNLSNSADRSKAVQASPESASVGVESWSPGLYKRARTYLPEKIDYMHAENR